MKMSNDNYIELDSKNSSLIIIDVQKDLTLKDAHAEIPETLQAVPNIQKIVNHFGKIKIFYI
jgi:hypothetical protein